MSSRGGRPFSTRAGVGRTSPFGSLLEVARAECARGGGGREGGGEGGKGGGKGGMGGGFRESVPATSVDRQCGSSEQAIHFAAQGIMAGSYDIAIACGVESMTRVPMGSNSNG